MQQMYEQSKDGYHRSSNHSLLFVLRQTRNKLHADAPDDFLAAVHRRCTCVSPDTNQK